MRKTKKNRKIITQKYVKQGANNDGDDDELREIDRQMKMHKNANRSYDTYTFLSLNNTLFVQV